jgi:hypothetical protein
MTFSDNPPSTLMLILIFCVAVSPCVIVLLNIFTIFCALDNPNPNGTDYGPGWFEELPIPPLYTGLSYVNYWSYSDNVLQPIYYSVAIIYGILTVRILKKKFNLIMYNEAAKSVERQLTRTMIAQVGFKYSVSQGFLHVSINTGL